MLFPFLNQPSNSMVQRTFAALSPLTFGVSRYVVCVSKLAANVFAGRHDVASINPQAGAGDAEHCNPLYAGYRHGSDALAGNGVVPPPPVAPSAAWPVLFVKRIDNGLFPRRHG